MPNNSKLCFQCGRKETKNLHGYNICSSCKSKLGLFTDETIQGHIAENYKQDKSAYKKEILRRLDFIDKDYAKKKIKLLDVLERL